MSIAEKLNQKYTYGDYAQWSDDERWELIEGVPFAMTAPLRIHQDVVFNIGLQIGLYMQGKPCKVYPAPFDVRLPRKDEADEDVETVVQPDIAVVCDPSKLDKKGCRGGPDWVIEVLSSSTIFRDMNVKRSLYEMHGVREYWLIHPEDRWLMAYTLDNEGGYGKPAVFNMEEPSPTALFPGLSIDWSFMQEL
jgi:Uma2 family endonuclease